MRRKAKKRPTPKNPLKSTTKNKNPRKKPKLKLRLPTVPEKWLPNETAPPLRASIAQAGIFATLLPRSQRPNNWKPLPLVTVLVRVGLSSSLVNIRSRSRPAERRLRRNLPRSEERRVGKECRSRWSPY